MNRQLIFYCDSLITDFSNDYKELVIFIHCEESLKEFIPLFYSVMHKSGDILNPFQNKHHKNRVVTHTSPPKIAQKVKEG